MLFQANVVSSCATVPLMCTAKSVSIKWTGVVDHVLPKWPPHVGLQPSVIAIQTVVFLCSTRDVQNTVCTCGLLDVPLHDVARLLAVDAIDVVKSHRYQRCKQVRAVSPSGVLI